MPNYEYRASDGEIIELYYKADAFPATVRRKGKRYKRIISTPQLMADIRPFVSHAMPTHLPYCKQDSQGRAVIQSRAELKEVAKRLGYVEKGEHHATG